MTDISSLVPISKSFTTIFLPVNPVTNYRGVPLVQFKKSEVGNLVRLSPYHCTMYSRFILAKNIDHFLSFLFLFSGVSRAPTPNFQVSGFAVENMF